MIRPPLEVADIVRTYGTAFIKQHRRWLTALHLKVLRAIVACRTAVLGGHIEQCDSCGQRAISYNSCLNRHCPKCQGAARQALVGETFRRTAARTLLSCRLYPAPRPGSLGFARTRLWFTACFFGPQPRPYSRSLPTPNISALRSGFWPSCILGPDAPASPASALRRPGWRALARSAALDSLWAQVLSARQSTQCCLSRKVSRRSRTSF